MDQGIIIGSQGLRNEVRDGGSKRPVTGAAGFSMHAARKASAPSLDSAGAADRGDTALFSESKTPEGIRPLSLGVRTPVRAQ